MFIKMSEIKKLMKEALKKGSLLIGNATLAEENDGLVIVGGWWALGVLYDYAPKELKAAVMEYGGEIPFEGYTYRATTEGNQVHTGISAAVNPAELFRMSHRKMIVSKVCVEFTESVRLLQDQDSDHIVGVKNRCLNMFDLKELCYDFGEIEPEGPYRCDNDVVSWGNNMCWLSVWPYKLLGEEVDNERQQFINFLEETRLLG